MARYILPWYGGSASVWTTCMLFFLSMLLVGYYYAFILSRYLSPKRQVIVHISLLIASLALLPFTPSESFKPDGGENPSASLLIMLIYSIGVPYVLVASTNPLYQNWFNIIYPDKNPFRLYSLSNLGSLIGLFSYPFVIEHVLPLRTQTTLMTAIYVLYVLLSLLCISPFLRSKSLSFHTVLRASEQTQSVAGIDKLLWIFLSATGVVLLLAVTNRINFDLPVVPFFWIAPLCLYLISFIICFNKPSWYNRRLWISLFIFSLVFIIYVGSRPVFSYILILRGVILSLILFISCMVLHGELYRLRPPPAGHLTRYYLLIAFGGALGGVFVAIVATNLFNDFWELYIGLTAVFILLGVVVLRSDSFDWTNHFLRGAALTWVLFLALFIWQTYAQLSMYEGNTIAKKRSFYGVLSVKEYVKSGYRYLSMESGAINHGGQFIDIDKRRIPTEYYVPESGVAIALRHYPKESFSAFGRSGGLKVGVLGMGIATISAHLNVHDEVTYYELDPNVNEVANDYFYYLPDSKSDYRVVIGDARTSLEREFNDGGSQNFDILIMDAFTGDAPPLHLLTEEAFNLYWNHLKQDGVLAINISNRYIDFRPLILGWAKKYGKQYIEVESKAGDADWISDATWVLVTGNEEFLNDPKLQNIQSENKTKLSEDKVSTMILTDENSNLFTLIKLSF